MAITGTGVAFEVGVPVGVKLAVGVKVEVGLGVGLEVCVHVGGRGVLVGRFFFSVSHGTTC